MSLQAGKGVMRTTSDLTSYPAQQSLLDRAQIQTQDSTPPCGGGQRQMGTTLEDLTKQQLLEVLQFIRERGGAELVDKAVNSLPVSSDIRTQGECLRTDGPRPDTGQKGKSKKGAAKEFDFSRFAERTIALQVSYDGDKYAGFASQGETDQTVEHQLFQALMKTKLVKDRAWARYSRCGRTDKGVSALRQVVGLRVRSSRPRNPNEADNDEASTSTAEAYHTAADTQIDDDADGETCEGLRSIWSEPVVPPFEGELDYCGILNRVLPQEIRVLGWAPAPKGFNARFCASHRTYRYFFSAEGLDLNAMRRAASLLEGDHDFRNFCKMDATVVRSFRRVVVYARIRKAADWVWADPPDGPTEEAARDGRKAGPDGTQETSEVCCLEICGQAFLWHMVRCIMAVLLFVGRGLEQPETVSYLLDVDKCPAKPHYNMAPEMPLVLHDCAFPPELRFTFLPAVLFRLWGELRASLAHHNVRAARVHNQLQYLATTQVKLAEVHSFIHDEVECRSGKGKKRKRGGGQATTPGSAAATERGPSDGMEVDQPQHNGRSREADDYMSFGEALKMMAEEQLVPGNEDKSRHTRLQDRKVGKSYDEIVAEMGGRKREAYEVNKQKWQSATETGKDQAFFERLRGEKSRDANRGSVALAGVS